jgi:hypothetical protein
MLIIPITDRANLGGLPDDFEGGGKYERKEIYRSYIT